MKCVACNARNIPLRDGHFVRNGYLEKSQVKRWDFYCKNCNEKDPAPIEERPGQGAGIGPAGEASELSDNMAGEAIPPTDW